MAKLGADPCNVVENFADRVEALVALEDDRCWRMAQQHKVEKIKRCTGYRVGM